MAKIKITSVPQMANGGDLSSEKAKEILRDGTANGAKLTSKQRAYMGWVAGGSKKAAGGKLDFMNYRSLGTWETGGDLEGYEGGTNAGADESGHGADYLRQPNSYLLKDPTALTPEQVQKRNEQLAEFPKLFPSVAKNFTNSKGEFDASLLQKGWNNSGTGNWVLDPKSQTMVNLSEKLAPQAAPTTPIVKPQTKVVRVPAFDNAGKQPTRLIEVPESADGGVLPFGSKTKDNGIDSATMGTPVGMSFDYGGSLLKWSKGGKMPKYDGLSNQSSTLQGTSANPDYTSGNQTVYTPPTQAMPSVQGVQMTSQDVNSALNTPTNLLKQNTQQPTPYSGSYNYLIPVAQAASDLGMMALASKFKPQGLQYSNYRPQNINMAPQRAQIASDASAAMRGNQMAMRNANVSPVQYMNAVGSANAETQSAANRAIGESAMAEQNANVGAQNQAAMYNNQQQMSVQQYNNQLKNQYNQQKLGMYYDLMNIPKNAMTDQMQGRQLQQQLQMQRPSYRFNQPQGLSWWNKISGNYNPNVTVAN